jgi:hypothetical protein
MRKHARLLLCAIVLAAAIAALAQQPQQPQPSQPEVPLPPTPVFEVMRTPAPIVVDGKLNDAAWAKTPVIGPLVNNRDGAPSTLQSEAKVLYDDKFIYFASRFVDDNIWATFKKRDEHLWTEEVVEVFIQADPAKKNYIELEVNPLGTMIDIYLLDFRSPLHYESWNSEKLQWAVQVDGTVDGKPGDKEWTCEMALPLEDVVTAPNLPPKPGDRWRMNFYRVEKLPERAGLAWSPTGRDYHRTERFGEIIFGSKLAR